MRHENQLRTNQPTGRSPAEILQRVSAFARGSLELIRHGNRAYRIWLGFLALLIVSGVLAYSQQVRYGLGLTAMRDQVSWGFYIGNFTFLVGVEAAAGGLGIT